MAEEAAFAAKYAGMILIVVDVESDGPSVRSNSMFALGGVAIEVASKTVLGGFSYCVRERPGAAKNDKTMAFWMDPKQRPMYDALHAAQVDMAAAMAGVADWVARLKTARPDASLVFASDCLPYDMKWADTELAEHVAPYVLGYSGLDIYSYLAAALKEPRHAVWKRVDALKAADVLCRAADGVVHDHHPYNDALHEAVLAVDAMRMVDALSWAPLRLPAAGATAPLNATWMA